MFSCCKSNKAIQTPAPVEQVSKDVETKTQVSEPEEAVVLSEEAAEEKSEDAAYNCCGAY